MLFITLKKEQNTFDFPEFCTYFFNLHFLLTGAQKYFLPQGAGYPIATSLQRWALNLGLQINFLHIAQTHLMLETNSTKL